MMGDRSRLDSNLIISESDAASPVVIFPGQARCTRGNTTLVRRRSCRQSCRMADEEVVAVLDFFNLVVPLEEPLKESFEDR